MESQNDGGSGSLGTEVRRSSAKPTALRKAQYLPSEWKTLPDRIKFLEHIQEKLGVLEELRNSVLPLWESAMGEIAEPEENERLDAFAYLAYADTEDQSTRDEIGTLRAHGERSLAMPSAAMAECKAAFLAWQARYPQLLKPSWLLDAAFTTVVSWSQNRREGQDSEGSQRLSWDYSPPGIALSGAEFGRGPTLPPCDIEAETLEEYKARVAPWIEEYWSGQRGNAKELGLVEPARHRRRKVKHDGVHRLLLRYLLDENLTLEDLADSCDSNGEGIDAFTLAKHVRALARDLGYSLRRGRRPQNRR